MTYLSIESINCTQGVPTKVQSSCPCKHNKHTCVHCAVGYEGGPDKYIRPFLNKNLSFKM